MAGRMAKNFATSFAMLKVVSAPRVISCSLPTSTMSMSFVGLESRSTMLPASRATWVPELIATPDVRLRQGGGVVRAVPDHRHQVAVLLLRADALQLRLRGGLRDVVVYSRFRGDGGRGQRVVSRDHDGADPHLAQVHRAGP